MQAGPHGRVWLGILSVQDCEVLLSFAAMLAACCLRELFALICVHLLFLRTMTAKLRFVHSSAAYSYIALLVRVTLGEVAHEFA